MTPSERYTKREDTAHLYEQRLDRESRFREPSEAEIEKRLAAIETYPHLAGEEEACREARRVLLQEQIAWHTAELTRLQEESGECPT